MLLEVQCVHVVLSIYVSLFFSMVGVAFREVAGFDRFATAFFLG